MDQTELQIIPEEFRRKTYVEVECKGEYTAGKTIADIREGARLEKFNAFVCTSVNADKMLKLLEERVFY